MNSKITAPKPNRFAIEQAVGDIFLEKAFEAAVQSIFMKAFPGYDVMKTSGKVHELTSFVHNALEAAGGYSLLINAIENETNASRKALLTDLNDLCIETALEASTRFALEAAEDEEELGDEGEEEPIEDDVTEEDDPTEGLENEEDANIDDETTETAPPKKILTGKNLQELALDAKMTDKELKSFGTKLEGLDSVKISSIVNDKIVKAIEDEKKSYEKIDEANDRLKAALTEKEDLDNKSEEEAYESINRVLDITLGENTYREHASLFSTLQVNTATALLGASESACIDNVATKVLCRTIPNRFKESTNLASSIEEAIGSQLACSNQTMNDNAGREKLIKLSTFISTVILTFIETMNTLNLQRYTTREVEDIVKTKGFDTCMTKTIANNVNETACNAIENCKRQVRCATECASLESALETVYKLHEKLTDIQHNGVAINKETFDALESVQTEIVDRVHKLSVDFDAAVEGCSYSTALKNDVGMDNAIVAMEHLGALISRKRPNRVICTLNESGAMEATFMRDNNPYFSHSMALEGCFETIGVEKYVDMLMKKTGIDKITYANGNKPEFKMIVR